MTVLYCSSQVVAEVLWSCLSPSLSALHREAARLLAWLHSLTFPSPVVEKTILQHFATQVRRCVLQSLYRVFNVFIAYRG